MTTNKEMLLATSGRDTGLETCIKCKHMTMEAPLGMPYFICDMNLDIEADECLGDRKSTRLNSSHQIISYAVFCLKKKTQPNRHMPTNADG